MDKLIVTEQDKDIRIDKFLGSELDVSRQRIHHLIKNEDILVNGNAVKASYKVKPEDVIEYVITPKEPLKLKPEAMDLDIVYEDDYLLVINKPSGIVVHPASGTPSGTLLNGILNHVDNLAQIGDESSRPGIVHRIDKDTSGLLMVAKTDEVHMNLAEQLKNKTVVRRYWALVHGVIEEDEGEIIAPIGRDVNNRQNMIVTEKNAKEAHTLYTVKERFLNYTLIECILKTGRTHQIRVHMQYINHPVCGDTKYGYKRTIDAQGQALHAHVLGFIHPITKEYLEFTAELPQEFIDALQVAKDERI